MDGAELLCCCSSSPSMQTSIWESSDKIANSILTFLSKLLSKHQALKKKQKKTSTTTHSFIHSLAKLGVKWFLKSWVWIKKKEDTQQLCLWNSSSHQNGYFSLKKHPFKKSWKHLNDLIHPASRQQTLQSKMIRVITLGWGWGGELQRMRLMGALIGYIILELWQNEKKLQVENTGY